ncbi:hypothetical protein NDU88_004653 [Pleurodeles waltl]|uniref:Uncharacterized protein n=1 Tax=Pleurodeles waltl TaxID=8319 RepID=A0AAV7LPY3_PLEWA|nr:hypothetical protein NDU88_004653 [Pleurodeles waltl]
MTVPLQDPVHHLAAPASRSRPLPRGPRFPNRGHDRQLQVSAIKSDLHRGQQGVRLRPSAKAIHRPSRWYRNQPTLLPSTARAQVPYASIPNVPTQSPSNVRGPHPPHKGQQRAPSRHSSNSAAAISQSHLLAPGHLSARATPPPGVAQARPGQPDSGPRCTGLQTGTPGDHNKPPSRLPAIKIPQGRIPFPDPSTTRGRHCGPASSARAIPRAALGAPLCPETGRFQWVAAARDPQGSNSRC